MAAGIPAIPLAVEGHPYVPAEHVAHMFWAGAVTPSYFRLLRIPILAGRAFSESDGEKSAPVVIVSAAMARRYWPGENPIGKHVRPVFAADWRTVVGVAEDVRQVPISPTIRPTTSGDPFTCLIASQSRTNGNCLMR